MSRTSASTTAPSILLPEKQASSPARHLRAVPDWRPPAAEAGPVVPSAQTPASMVPPGPAASPRRSFAPAPVDRARRPLGSGGAPPTVIRDLDALFAADRRRRSSAPPPPRPSLAPVAPMEPKDLAQALLAKVERDFGKAPTAPAVRFVVSAPTQRDEATHYLALPADDEDVVRLTPWYTRLYRALFGG